MSRRGVKWSAVLLPVLWLPVVQAESLVDYVQQVRQTDPRFVMSEAAQDRDTARSDQMRAKLLPQVVLQGGWNRSEQDVFGSKIFDAGPTNGKKFIASVQQPLLNIGSMYGYSASKAVVSQTEKQKMQIQSEAMMDAIDRYLLALSAAEKLKLAREEESIALKQLDQVQGLRDRQMATITDLLAIQARSDVLRVYRIRAEVEYRAAMDGLEQLTGEPVRGLQGLNDDQVTFAVEQPLSWWQEKVAKANWAIQALEAGKEAARLSVMQSKAATLPVISLQVATQQTDLGYQNNPVPRSRSNYAAVDITMPLFTGGGQLAAVHEASANERMATMQYEKTSREISTRVKSSYMQLQSLSAAISAAKRTVESTSQSVAAKQRSYQLGLESITYVLEAQRDFYAAQRDFADVRHEFIRQWSVLNLYGASLDMEAVTLANAWLTQPVTIP